jgi:hypothetical protein
MAGEGDQKVKPTRNKRPVKKQGNFKKGHPWRRENWKEPKVKLFKED